MPFWRNSQWICSWNLRLGIIDIKVEKYKLIVPDSYSGRYVISVYDTCTVTRWYDVGKVTALKINTCSSCQVVRFVAYVTKLTGIFEQTTTFMAACYGLALNTRLSAELCSSGEIDLYSGLVMVSYNSLP